MSLRGRIYRLLPKRLRGECIRRVERADGLVALTFDDCNLPGPWQDILDVLRKEAIKATFFAGEIGFVEQRALAHRTFQEGHLLGSHGWDHARLKGMPIRQVWQRIRNDAHALEAAVGASSAPHFRPPFCSYDRKVLLAAALAGHHRTVLWDVDSCDWDTAEPTDIVRNVMRYARSGSIILLHTRPQTAEAVPRLIDELRKRELQPVTLTKLFEGHEKDFSARVGHD